MKTGLSLNLFQRNTKTLQLLITYIGPTRFIMRQLTYNKSHSDFVFSWYGAACFAYVIPGVKWLGLCNVRI